MERVMAWAPERIVATHFGAYGDVRGHFEELREGLDAWSGWVGASLGGGGGGVGDGGMVGGGAVGRGAGGGGGREGVAGGGGTRDDPERARDFAAWVVEGLGGVVSEEVVDRYETASGFPDSWWGLARYWRKRTGV